jgi:phosphohistidine phosphatase
MAETRTPDTQPLTLYLIRHAHAGQGDPSDPHDHQRPLSAKGRAQAAALGAALAGLEVRFDRLFSSPYTRAAETAAPLVAHTKGGRAEPLSALTHDDYPGLLSVLATTLGAGDRRVALVGHEPYLSELAAYLLTGEASGMALRMRKGMLVRLEGLLKPGRMALHTALPPKLVRQLAQS